MPGKGTIWKIKTGIGGSGGGLPPYSIHGTPITAASVGDDTAARFTVVASAGAVPYVYSVSSGTLPTGQTINSSTGLVSGVISAAGTYSSIILKATDANGQVALLTPYTVIVSAVAVDFSVTGTPITSATVGTAMTSFQFTAVGATAPVTWTFDTTNGYTPPVGITVSAGLVSGTPATNADGVYRLRVKAVDNLGGIGYSAIWSLEVRLAAGAGVFRPTQAADWSAWILPTKASGMTFDLTGMTMKQGVSANPDPDDTEWWSGDDLVYRSPATVIPPENGGPAASHQEYPLRSGNTPSVVLRGGRMDGYTNPVPDLWLYDHDLRTGRPVQGGSVPYDTHNYQNSAAMLIDGGDVTAPGFVAHASRMRIKNVWDGFRVKLYCGLDSHASSWPNPAGTPEFGTNTTHIQDAMRGLAHTYISEYWVENARDDLMETDGGLQSVTMTDCLFDGSFAGISMDPGAVSGPALLSHEIYDMVTLDRVLMRLGNYPNRASTVTGNHPNAYYDALPPPYDAYGPAFKTHVACQSITCIDTIICIDGISANNSVSRWTTAWQRMTNGYGSVSGACYLLWTASDTFPTSSISTGAIPIPAGWTTVTGQTARDQWAAAKAAWIAAHPWVHKMDTD